MYDFHQFPCLALSYQSGHCFLSLQTAVGGVSQFEREVSYTAGEMADDGLLFFVPLGLVEVLRDRLASCQSYL